MKKILNVVIPTIFVVPFSYDENNDTISCILCEAPIVKDTYLSVGLQCSLSTTSHTLINILNAFLCNDCCCEDKFPISVLLNEDMIFYMHLVNYRCIQSLDCVSTSAKMCIHKFIMSFTNDDVITFGKLSNLCWYCSATNPTPTNRCGGCDLARYCDRKCMNKHWKDHKLYCIHSKQTIKTLFYHTQVMIIKHDNLS